MMQQQLPGSSQCHSKPLMRWDMQTDCCILNSQAPKSIPHSCLQDERAHCCPAESSKGFPAQSANGVILAREASAEAAARLTGASCTARLADPAATSCGQAVQLWPRHPAALQVDARQSFLEQDARLESLHSSEEPLHVQPLHLTKAQREGLARWAFNVSRLRHLYLHLPALPQKAKLMLQQHFSPAAICNVDKASQHLCPTRMCR